VKKIWTIDRSNLSTALAEIHLDDDVEAEIRSSVIAGKTVTTHTDQITYNGWTGEGYIITDPETGTGAYKISGGSNGGYLEYYESISGKISATLFVSGLLLGLVASPLAIIGVALLIIGLFHAFMTYMIADLTLTENGCPEGMHTLLLVMSALFALLPKALSSGIVRSLVMPLYSFLTLSTVKAGSGACEYVSP